MTSAQNSIIVSKNFANRFQIIFYEPRNYVEPSACSQKLYPHKGFGKFLGSFFLIIFPDRFEQQALQNAALKPELLMRYINDYTGFWLHGERALIEFVEYLNNLHPKLAFTLDYSKENKGVPFLDTLVTVTASGTGEVKLETELYIKPTNSGIVMHERSAHPTSTKHNMIRNMFHRALNHSSNKEKEECSIAKIKELLLGNGYSPQLLKRLLWEVRNARRNKGTARKRAVGGDGFLTLPYIDEGLLRKVKQVVNKSGLNVKLASRNDYKLKKQLVRSAFTKPPCPGGTGVTYARPISGANVLRRIWCTYLNARFVLPTT